MVTFFWRNWGNPRICMESWPSDLDFYRNSPATETEIFTSQVRAEDNLVRFVVFQALTMNNVVFWNIETRFIPHKKEHYVSATESSRLMLCKICGFHSGNYEECCLLGYKNPVHTPQETHYVSATESSRLMLCKIWGLHDNDYEECRPLGCEAV
jgi:hypothetical protein